MTNKKLTILLFIVSIIIGNLYYTNKKQDKYYDARYLHESFMRICMKENNFGSCDCLFDSLVDKLDRNEMYSLYFDYMNTEKISSTSTLILKECIERDEFYQSYFESMGEHY